MMQNGGSDSSSSQISEECSGCCSPEQSAVNKLIQSSPQSIFYIDQISPFLKAPPIVKTILLNAKDQHQCINLDNIDLNLLTFQPKISQNHFCNYMFNRNQDTYYHCHECTGKNWQTDRVIFCQGCFVPADHVGHHYYSQICRVRECFCDCGSNDKTNTLFRCAKHHEDKKIQVLIDEKQKEEFLAIFGSLIQVGCYFEGNGGLFSSIIQKLSTLCRNSLYYSTLTLNLLKQKSICLPDNDELHTKHFLPILFWSDDISALCVQICSNKQLQMQLAKFLLQIYKVGSEALDEQIRISGFVVNMIFSYNVLEKLVEEGCGNRGIFNRFELYVNQSQYKKGKQLFNRYLVHVIRSMTELEQDLSQKLIKNQTTIITPQLAIQCLKLYISKYPQIKTSKTAQNPKKPKKNKLPSRQPLHQDIKLNHDIIMRSIIILTNADRNRLVNIRDQFRDLGIDVSRFQEILEQIVYHAPDYFFMKVSCFGNQTPVSMIALILIIKKSTKSDKIIDLFWKSQIGQGIKYENIVANVYEMVSAIIWADTHLVLFEKILEKVRPSEMICCRDKELTDFFVRFLSLKQLIPRQQLLDMRKQNLLQVPDIGKILRTTCTYNSDDQIFYYNSQAPQQKFKDKFAFFLKQTDVPAMCVSMYANTNIYFGFQENLSQKLEDYQLEILQLLMNSNVLMEIVKENWEIVGKNKQNQEKCGYLFIFILILVNGFTGGQNTNIKNKLEQIREIIMKKEPNIYSKSQTQINLNQRLFNMIKIENNNHSAQNDQMKQQHPINTLPTKQQLQKRKKFQQKRQKIQQRYQQKRTTILQSLQSKSLDTESHEQICLTCHEKDRKNDPLVYLGRVGANNSLCRAMHGEDDKANISAVSCFHLLHLGCFIGSHKKGKSFPCPYCNAVTNCFFVRDFQKVQPETKKIFSNIIISSLVNESRVYDIQNYFMALFKHFVQARGLKSLINRIQNWQKHKLTDKSDNFLQHCMITIFNSADQKQKEEYMRDIDKFMGSLNQCQNQAAKLVQLIMVKALKSKLLDGQYARLSVQELLTLKKILRQKQFEVVKEEAESILNQQLVLPEYTGLQLPEQQKKTLTFTLKQLPIDSTKFTQFTFNNFCYKNHNKKMDFYCLICGKGICQQCNDQKYELEHCGLSAYLSLENYMVYFSSSIMGTESDVYFNDFKVSYNDKSDYGMEEEVYRLNIVDFQALVQEFMG